MSDALELRSERRASGLSVAALARAAGSSESNVAAYERHAKDPSQATLGRLRSLIAVGGRSPIFVNRLVTVPAAASSLRKGLREDWMTPDLLRVVRECLSNSRWVTTEAEREAFFSVPSTTGDRRWDALLAGAVEHHCLTNGLSVPLWTHGKTAGALWFLSHNPSLHAYLLAHSPSSLRVRGVLLDPDDLVSV